MSHVLKVRRDAERADFYCECGQPIGAMTINPPASERWRQELMERHRQHVRSAVGARTQKMPVCFQLQSDAEARALAAILDALHGRVQVVRFDYSTVR